MKQLSTLSSGFFVSVSLIFAACQQSASAPAGEVVTPLAPSLEKRVDDREKTARIISGQLVFAGNTQSIDLKGTQGIRLVGAVLEPIVNLQPFISCLPCEPGAPISLDGRIVGLSLAGTVTLRGATYAIGSGLFDAGADLRFSGDGVVAPPMADHPVQLSAAVQLSGGEPIEPSTLFTPVDPDGQPFTGQGVVTMVFERVPGTDLWQITSAVYEF